MTIYHPHCNQHICYHDGGTHQRTPATAAVATSAVQPYYLYAEYNPDGTKDVYKIKNNNTPWEKQVERQKELRQYHEEWVDGVRSAPRLILIGMTFVAAFIGYAYLMEAYLMPVLRQILP